MKLPLIETLLVLFRGGVWYTDRSPHLFDVLIEKGYAQKELGYCFITRTGVILLSDIGAIQT